MKVTILTTTYNRSNTLKRLYNSLVNQTSDNFEWLIIDDGSTDNTKILINDFISEKKISIRYFYIANGGKHRALNYGINIIENEITIFVDSDDWLEKNAIDTIIYFGKKYYNNKDIATISFLKADISGKINGPIYNKDEYIGNYIKDRINNNNWGDKAEVCFTKKLKEFKFLEIEGEKFLAEGYLWINMAFKYKTVYINKIIYYAEYQQEGLTKNIYKYRINNPKGCIELAKLQCSKLFILKTRIKNMIKYITYSIFDNRSLCKQLKCIDNKFLYIFAFLPGILFYFYVRNITKE